MCYLRYQFYILVLLFTSWSNAQSIFEQSGKFGIKENNGSVVLDAEYDSISQYLENLPDAPIYRIALNGKYGLVLFVKDSLGEFYWHNEKCIYDSIVPGATQADWKPIVEEVSQKQSGGLLFTYDMIKDGKHQFVCVNAFGHNPFELTPYGLKQQGVVFDEFNFIVKYPIIYDSVITFADFEMYYNENGYKLYGFVPLKEKPVSHFYDDNGVLQKLPVYRKESRDKKSYLPRYLNFVSYMKDGKLSLVNWLGNQTPYEFEPGDFKQATYWLYTIAPNYHLRIFDIVTLDELKLPDYIGDLYQTDEDKIYLQKYYFRKNESYMLVNPDNIKARRNPIDVNFKKYKTNKSLLTYLDNDLIIYQTSKDTACRYQMEGHRFEIIHDSKYGLLNISGLDGYINQLPYNRFIIDYNLIGKSDNCIPFEIIDIESTQKYGGFKLKKRYRYNIISQEPHFDSLMKREYVAFYFENSRPKFFVSKSKELKRNFTCFAIYDPEKGKTYRSLKHWYKGKAIKSK